MATGQAFGTGSRMHRGPRVREAGARQHAIHRRAWGVVQVTHQHDRLTRAERRHHFADLGGANLLEQSRRRTHEVRFGVRAGERDGAAIDRRAGEHPTPNQHDALSNLPEVHGEVLTARRIDAHAIGIDEQRVMIHETDQASHEADVDVV